MSQLIRLTYASRSTSPPEGKAQGLDLGVARILAKSRKNNRQRHIVGGLLFGDGCFLQCLEGEEDVVSALYTKIEADLRHRDVKVLMRAFISERTFGDWSMKYVPGERALGDLMRGWGMTRFDPYVLSPEQLEAAVVYLRKQADAAQQLPQEGPSQQAPQSYIGKNVPEPRAAKRSDGLERPPERASSGHLKWVMVAGAVVLIGVLLYLMAR